MSNYKTTDLIKLLILVILWAAAYSLGKIALETMSPIVLVFTRLLVGTIFMGGVLIVTKVRLPSFTNYRVWVSMSAVGVIGSLLPFFLIAESQTRVPSALASIYLAITPLSAALLAYIFIPSEKISLVKIIGVLLGVVGAVILAIPDFTQWPVNGFGGGVGGSFGKAPMGAQLQLFAAAFCYGAAIILVRIGAPNINPIAMSFGFIFISTIVAFPMAINDIAANYNNYSAKSLFSAILIGIGPTALAGILYVEAVHKVGPLMVANFSNLVPFAASFIGYIFFREYLPISVFIGLFVILFGVFLVQKAK